METDSEIELHAGVALLSIFRRELEEGEISIL